MDIYVVVADDMEIEWTEFWIAAAFTTETEAKAYIAKEESRSDEYCLRISRVGLGESVPVKERKVIENELDRIEGDALRARRAGCA